MTEPKNLICEIRILDSRRLRLEIDGLLIDGEHTLGPSLADDIAPLDDPQKAGARLFDALLPDDQPTLEAYRKITQEFRQLGALQRIRLHLEDEAPDFLHGLPWELLFDPRRRIGLGRSHDISFLRAVPGKDRNLEPVRGKMGILVAVAGPSDVLQHNLPALDRRYEERTLVASLRRLHDLVTCEILDAPVTTRRLRKRLQSGKFHTLHLVAHGRRLPHEDAARILLENDQGQGVWVDADELTEALAPAGLHLMTLVACHDGIETRSDPFFGLGPRLAAQVAPAVVTTRRALTVSQAAKMTSHLYRGLALSGRIDEAVNEARERLFHSRPERRTWASPTAFLCGGRPFIWHSEEARRRQVEEDTQALELVQFRLEQHRREQLAAVAEEPAPPEPEANPWRWAASGLAVVALALALSLAGALGYGPLAGLWQQDSEIQGLDIRARDSVDPEATRRAIPRYASACDQGNAAACARLGAIYDLGRGVDPDDPQARAYYLRACDLGDAGSCYHLGRLLESIGDLADATPFYERACGGDDLRACRRLSVQRQAVPETIARRATDRVPDLGETSDGAGSDDGESSSTVTPDVGGAVLSDGELASSTTGTTTSTGVASSSVSASDPASRTAGSAGTVRSVPVDGRSEPPGEPDMPTVAPSSGEADRWIYEVGGLAQTNTLLGHARGNVYRILVDAELLAWEVWLDFEDQQELTFSVHEAQDDLGSFTAQLSRTVTVQGTGPGWYASGDLSAQLKAGRSYLIAVSWNGEVAYAYDQGPQELFFAQLVHGHVDLDPILPEVESETLDRAAYRQRLLVSYEASVDGEGPPGITAQTADLRLHDVEARRDETPPDDTDTPGEPGKAGASLYELGPWDLSLDETRSPSAAENDGRGNLVRMAADTRLVGADMWLEPILPGTELTLYVLSSEKRQGPYEILHRESWTPPEVDPGWFAAPSFDVTLSRDQYVAVLFAWDEPVYYRFTASEAQVADGLGTVLQGVATSAGFTTPPPDRALYLQRWRSVAPESEP